MTDFVVSARKYRPSNFEEIIGQNTVSLTLKNAIKNNHLAQSFLFCGPRGVGKTSCARILAKTINCTSLTEECNPCNTCSSCTSFNQATSFNIHELDAASNNGVDKIRELIDQVRFAPQIGEFNVYIIDEVHMLSANAFNAFLKTLEEPPKHAKFILATTEKHKIIPTILSRCQIFDFKRISVEDIISHLDFISKSEKINTENEGLHIIAEKADGSLRDALSIFDRLVSFSLKELTYKHVINHLQVLDYDYYFRTVDAITNGEISEIMLIFNEILDNGFDGQHFIIGLSEHLRDLLVCKTENTVHLITKGKDLQERYLLQSNTVDIDFLINGLSLCNECDCQYKSSMNQRLLVELCLLQITTGKKKTEEKIAFLVPHTKVETKTIKKKMISEENPTNITIYEDHKKDHNVQNIVSNQDAILIPPTSEIIESKTISISETLAEINNRAEKKSNISSKNSSFSNDELQDYWSELTTKLKKDGKINLSIALSTHQPELSNKNTIQIFIDNKAQEELVFDEKSNLANLLSNKFNNDYISITTKVLENKGEIPVYTNKEIFERMQQENPNLKELSRKFILDSDY